MVNVLVRMPIDAAAIQHPASSLLTNLPKLVNHFRTHLQEPVRKDSRHSTFTMAISDPATLNTVLVLAANHWIIIGGQRNVMKSQLYQHKMETIRIVNERLGDPELATSDGTIGAVACLMLLEVSLI